MRRAVLVVDPPTLHDAEEALERQRMPLGRHPIRRCRCPLESHHRELHAIMQ